LVLSPTGNNTYMAAGFPYRRVGKNTNNGAKNKSLPPLTDKLIDSAILKSLCESFYNCEAYKCIGFIC